MGISGLIDLAIGLILLYLVLSLICTTINEFIATWLKLRAKMLAGTLEKIIDDPDLKKAFFANGIISDAGVAAGGAPSYIASRNFALAVIGSLDPAKPLPAYQDIQSAIENLPSSNVKDALVASLLSADQDVVKLRDEIATWFDSAMDRLSGQYKRRLKVVTLVIGLGVALVLNADTLAIGRALWNDDTLRAQIADNAAKLVEQCQANTACVKTDSPPNTGDLVEDSKTLLHRLKDQQDALRPFPLGWDTNELPGLSTWEVVAWTLLKILGLLWTAAALTIGAPFWFDLLSKFVSIRGTGVKPPTTAEQKPTK